MEGEVALSGPESYESFAGNVEKSESCLMSKEHQRNVHNPYDPVRILIRSICSHRFVITTSPHSNDLVSLFSTGKVIQRHRRLQVEFSKSQLMQQNKRNMA